MVNEQIQHLNKLKQIHQNNLRLLEEQEAKFGANYVPLPLINEIEAQKIKIEEINSQIVKLEAIAENSYSEWDAEIKAHLDSARIILLLISPRFIASEYCYDREMQRAMERHKAGTAQVIPIILKPVDWKDTPFSILQVLPKDGKPITIWDNHDEAFLNVVQGIRRTVESLK